jgi:hypothetical protein
VIARLRRSLEVISSPLVSGVHLSK